MTDSRGHRSLTRSAAAGAAAVAVTTVGVLPVYMVGVLWVQLQEDLGFGPELLGTLVAIFFFTSAVSALGAGAVVNHFGTSPVVRLSAVVAAVSMLVIALAAQHTAVLLAALVLGGWGNGLGQPASNDLIARGVDSSRHGLAYGCKQAAIPLSTLIAGVAVLLVAIPWGWRPAFAVGAALALIATPIVPATSRLSAPGWHEPTEAAGPFRRAPLYVLALGLMLGAATGNALGSFLVATAVDGGIAPSAAGVLAVGASVLGVAVRIGLGWLADRIRTRWLVVVAVQMAIGGASYTMLATGVELFIVVGAVIGYCTGWAWAGLSNFSVARMHPGMAARATSITQVGTGAGAALGPLLFGVVVSETSYSVAWYATGALSVAAGAVVVQGRRMLIKERPGLVAARQHRRLARPPKRVL